jgi:hypothetical protein
MVEKLLRCTQCNQVIPRVDSFGDFGESSLLFGVEWSSEDLDREKEFFLRHEGHLLEELTVDPETFVSDKPSYEPIKTSYVEASNGTRKFVIKRTRPSLDRPVSYELVPGAMRVSDVALEIREDEVLEEITWLNGAFPVPEDEARRPLEPFREETGSISDENLSAAVEKILSGETPLLPCGSFSEKLWEKVFKRCEDDLQASELNMIQEFIRNNRGAHEGLTLQIRKKVPISAPRA